MEQQHCFNPEVIPDMLEQEPERQILQSVDLSSEKISFEPCEYVLLHTGKVFYVENGYERIISLYYNSGPGKGRIAYEMIFPIWYTNYQMVKTPLLDSPFLKSNYKLSREKSYEKGRINYAYFVGPHNFDSMIRRKCRMIELKGSEIHKYYDGDYERYYDEWHNEENVCCHTPLDEYKRQIELASIIVRQWYPNGQLFFSVVSGQTDCNPRGLFYQKVRETPYNINGAPWLDRHYHCELFDKEGKQIGKRTVDAWGQLL